MLAPVVLFVYNRLDHTTRVIETLAQNVLAKETELFVFSDAAKSEKGLDKVNAVREYINRTDWRNGFKAVTVVQAEKNKGLAKSVIGGVTDIIEKYGLGVLYKTGDVDSLVEAMRTLHEDVTQYYSYQENIRNYNKKNMEDCSKILINVIMQMNE